MIEEKITFRCKYLIHLYLQKKFDEFETHQPLLYL